MRNALTRKKMIKEDIGDKNKNSCLIVYAEKQNEMMRKLYVNTGASVCIFLEDLFDKGKPLLSKTDTDVSYSK